MELDVLKSAWKDTATGTKRNEEIRLMLRENRHPVLKGIRRQLTIEIIAWTIFLFVYYDFFDGHLKPLYSNLLLAGSVVFMLVHSIIGYFFHRSPGKGNNLKQSLEDYLRKLKAYAITSIVSRVLSVSCILLFFISTIKFDASRYLVLTGIILLIAFQAIILSVIWSKRVRQLKETISGLS